MARRALMVSAAVAVLATGQSLNGQGAAPPAANQGWTDRDRSFWYWTTQGSRLMPELWMRSLERAEDTTKFLSPENINRYRYLTSGMQDGLPVGFAVDGRDASELELERTRVSWLPDQRDDVPWIGFTCAACHTAEIDLGPRTVRIDGAPGMGDFQRFVEDVDRALVATRDSAAATDSAKWRRFAAAVLRNRDTPTNRNSLLRALNEHIGRRQQVAAMNVTPIRYGFSRVDAIGYIYNQASLFARAPTPTANMPSAPVSYPFLWNVPQHNVVQWNGSVGRERKKLPFTSRTLDIGAMGRNAGEVIGVFGEVRTDVSGNFPSSVHPGNLARLEVMLQRLRPPSWRLEMPGTINEPAAARGQRIFEQQCSGCHAPLLRDDLGTDIIADMSFFGEGAPARKPIGSTIPAMPNIAPGTDPLMACNAFFRSAATGRLEGRSFAGPLATRPLAARDSVLAMLSVTVRSSLENKKKDIIRAFLSDAGKEKMPQPGGSAKLPRAAPPAATPSANPFPGLPSEYQRCVGYRWTGQEAQILGYKARPLTGIWATAPYLHNGSVPNLYELLLPPERRMRSFWLGSREFDSRHVGFVTEQSSANTFRFDTRDAQGNVIWGNFNGGHDYNNAALDRNDGRDRWDLVEYLKTL